MGETVEDAAAISKSKPTISVPPRGSMDALYINWSGLGFSPGPMTLVSSYLSDQGPFSFSQLLAGAMASPIVGKPGILLTGDSGKEVKEESLSKDEKNSESGGGYKRSRPMNLVVAQPSAPLEPQSLSPMFMFTPGLSPSGLLNSPGFLSPLQSPFGMSHQQALAHVTAQAALSQSFLQMQEELHVMSSTATTKALPDHSSSAPCETAPQANTLPAVPGTSKMESSEVCKVSLSSKIESSEVSQFDRKVAPATGDKPASDGYNWRKYGQKHVKASECPRSYYKCTHLNCPVKKKVERSFDGCISEITYKGQHNHDPPQPNKRGTGGCASDKTINTLVKPASDLRQTEKNGFNEPVAIHSEPPNFQASTQKLFEHRHTSNHNEENDDIAVVSVDGDDGEPVAKRRSIESGASLPAPSQPVVTESKIVVQTRSEVDLLDDGFKWRKYGQKIVKGNHHPRSYYRCTYSGCDVRKHVERASADPKCVITTYEGKHNHEIPVGRYNKHGAASANAHHLNTQYVEVKNSTASGEKNFGNKNQIPTSLQFKEEQIVAA